MNINIEGMKEVGFDTNVKAATEGHYLILVVDLDVDLGPSSTGKMNFVANTGGFQAFPGGLKGSVMIGKKAN